MFSLPGGFLPIGSDVTGPRMERNTAIMNAKQRGWRSENVASALLLNHGAGYRCSSTARTQGYKHKQNLAPNFAPSFLTCLPSQPQTTFTVLPFTLSSCLFSAYCHPCKQNQAQSSQYSIDSTDGFRTGHHATQGIAWDVGSATGLTAIRLLDTRQANIPTRVRYRSPMKATHSGKQARRWRPERRPNASVRD